MSFRTRPAELQVGRRSPSRCLQSSAIVWVIAGSQNNQGGAAGRVRPVHATPPSVFKEGSSRRSPPMLVGSALSRGAARRCGRAFPWVASQFRLQLHLAEAGASICNRRRIMSAELTCRPHAVQAGPPGNATNCGDIIALNSSCTLSGNRSSLQ